MKKEINNKWDTKEKEKCMVDKDKKIEKDPKEEILEKAAEEYYSSGVDELKKERFNAAVVLFFKSLIAFVDLLIYIKNRTTPSSHSERFRITQYSFPQVYDLIDKDFPFYQDSYIQIMNKELAEVIKEDARTVAEKANIKLQ